MYLYLYISLKKNSGDNREKTVERDPPWVIEFVAKDWIEYNIIIIIVKTTNELYLMKSCYKYVAGISYLNILILIKLPDIKHD